jgi:adenylate cyclase
LRSRLRAEEQGLENPQNTIRGFLGYVWHGGPSAAGIPARVMAEIDAREAAAERLIGWVQLGIVVFFAMLYSLTPRAEGGSGENFVPLTLAAYFLFTVFRVALSYRMTLPRWYLILSIIADVTLLCGLIFSFHIQYAQPPSFYLKAPTLMYLFIFISLRALRFDPRFVLITGVIGALGWLGLAGYALFADMGHMLITRNYVEYLTSNAILVGAEIDKSITILGVTAILSLVLYRGRQMLFEAIQSHVAAEDLKRFFAPDVASSITLSDDLPMVGQGEMRHAAILFVDVRSFTTTVEGMLPEAVMRILARYQEIALPEIERHNGQVDKFLGDGILATFGAVRPSETYAADALRAAGAVIDAFAAEGDAFRALGWPGPFQIGAAVACGGVTVGVVGARGRLEFTVIGNAVNLAAKLEAMNKQQGTGALTDSVSYAVAREQGFDNGPLPVRHGLVVPGLSRPVDVVVLA